MLQKIAEPEIAVLYQTPDLSDHNREEMLFIRLWAFYKLWDWYRKAPIQDGRISSIEGAILPPSSGFEMLDHAIGYINLGNWTATDFGFPYEASLFAFDSDKHLLFPIPVSELERNPLMAASGQNPGY